MALTSGTHLGPYEILAPIGKGGMGEVYKANDTRLDRTVAIKVLPEHLAESPERKQRFEREAKAISQLNHPHICTLFDVGSQDGIDYLVMEYIEGETLAERLKKGPLPLDEALEYGIQIADGLDTAHRAGIVHRDLKPGNIIIKDGIKLLDFGLAKIVGESLVAEGSDAPTRVKDLTGDQAIVGTLQYMAPEQLEGKTVDARADMFAFGALLYEMLTGQKAFEGESQASLIAAIMGSDPRPPSAVAEVVPLALDRFVQKCLAKSREDRWQTARDVTTELEWLRAHREAPESTAAGAVGRRPSLRWLAAAALVGGLVVAAAWVSRQHDAASPLVSRMVIPLPEGQRLVERPTPPIAISPDGRKLVYAATESESDADSRLYLRPLESFESTPISGTEGGHSPFFSPDGEWVGFFTDTELKKVALAGGVPTPLAPVESLSLGASWGPDGTIVYAPLVGAGGFLMKVSQAGGRPERIVGTGGTQPGAPQILPDGETVLFTRGGGDDLQGTWLATLSGGESRKLESGKSTIALFVPTGHLLKARTDATLDAVSFDPRRGTTRGDSVPVLHDVLMNATASTAYLAVASAGTIAYVTGAQTEEYLVRVDRQGNAQRLTKGPVHAPRFAPDGKRVAYGSGADIYVYDIVRDSSTRLTGTPGMVAWKPGGRLLLHGGPGLFLTPADGSGTSERLFARDLNVAVESSSPDGRYVAFTESHSETGLDIWVFPLEGEPFPFLATKAAENAAQFSPDGRYLAYQSNESGEREVYVRPFPEGNARWKISSAGGTAPVWSPSGDELFYRQGTAMMVVDVTLGDDFNSGRPRELFTGDFEFDNTGHPGYDIAPDGQSFVMSQQSRDEPLTEIHVVVNWFEELKRLVPVEN